MSQTVMEILNGCRLFGQVSPDGLSKLAGLARLVKYRKNQTIFREQQPCPGAFIVGSGLVRVFKTAPNGKEHVLHMVGPGNTFAEVAAIGGFPCPAAAQAVAATTCAVLPADLFRQALEQDHRLCLEMLVGLTFWVRHLISLMEDVVLRDAIGRLARFLLDTEPAADGTIELPGLKRHIASHLNLTSETFSRTLGRLIEAGLVVEYDANRMKLLDRKQLQRLAAGLEGRG